MPPPAITNTKTRKVPYFHPDAVFPQGQRTITLFCAPRGWLLSEIKGQVPNPFPGVLRIPEERLRVVRPVPAGAGRLPTSIQKPYKACVVYNSSTEPPSVYNEMISFLPHYSLLWMRQHLSHSNVCACFQEIHRRPCPPLMDYMLISAIRIVAFQRVIGYKWR